MSSSASTTETEHRWFILPLYAKRAQFENSPAAEWVPEYTDRDGISGWSGTDYHFEEGTFPALPFAGEEMFVGKLYGTPDALDAVAAESGAHGRQAYGLSKGAIAGYLNDRLGRQRAFEEWVDVFGVG